MAALANLHAAATAQSKVCGAIVVTIAVEVVALPACEAQRHSQADAPTVRQRYTYKCVTSSSLPGIIARASELIGAALKNGDPQPSASIMATPAKGPKH